MSDSEYRILRQRMIAATYTTYHTSDQILAEFDAFKKAVVDSLFTTFLDSREIGAAFRVFVQVGRAAELDTTCAVYDAVRRICHAHTVGDSIDDADLAEVLSKMPVLTEFVAKEVKALDVLIKRNKPKRPWELLPIIKFSSSVVCIASAIYGMIFPESFPITALLNGILLTMPTFAAYLPDRSQERYEKQVAFIRSLGYLHEILELCKDGTGYVTHLASHLRQKLKNGTANEDETHAIMQIFTTFHSHFTLRSARLNSIWDDSTLWRMYGEMAE
ncbi:hypothetical protein K438DRAFT_1962603 [Mycena galopus ATCC 62051]|nr:hypothetical protein K438DRAFT_1962603 [Mycena galopus ATCC 62051]